jgi:hypothetical protein
VNIVPADSNGIAFGRTTGQVLNVVYLNPGRAPPAASSRTGERRHPHQRLPHTH